jgi:hypothetical protein
MDDMIPSGKYTIRHGIEGICNFCGEKDGKIIFHKKICKRCLEEGKDGGYYKRNEYCLCEFFGEEASHYYFAIFDPPWIFHVKCKRCGLYVMEDEEAK